jgi:hypothetical protein
VKQTIEFGLAEIRADREAVFAHQGIPQHADVPQRILALYEEAASLFAARARPRGLIAEISGEEFGEVFTGEGNNADDAVVANVFPKADRLALFAATMGGEVSQAIAGLFDNNDFALGVMLDAVASMTADRTSEVIADHYHAYLAAEGGATATHFVLGYSPGYCGWHITGQRKLFAHLTPDEIGMVLNDSCLMSPLKSVSGVLIAGGRDVHIFKPGYGYCRQCKNHSCLARMERLMAAERADA